MLEEKECELENKVSAESNKAKLEDILKIIGVFYFLIGLIAVVILAIIDWGRSWQIFLLSIPVVISAILLFFIPAEIILLLRENNEELRKITNEIKRDD